MAVKSIAVHFQWQTSEAYFMWGDITLFFLSAFGMHIDIPFALRQSKRERLCHSSQHHYLLWHLKKGNMVQGFCLLIRFPFRHKEHYEPRRICEEEGEKIDF